MFLSLFFSLPPSSLKHNKTYPRVRVKKKKTETSMFDEGRADTAQQKFLKKKVITLKHFNIVFLKMSHLFIT